MTKKYNFTKIVKTSANPRMSSKKVKKESVDLSKEEKTVIMSMRNSETDSPISSLVVSDRNLLKLKQDLKIAKMK